MSAELRSDPKFEIGHVLFIDIVGYSKLLISEQSDLLQKLKEIVRGADQVRLAEAEGKLLRLPTGDGGALVFRTSPEAPVICALEISRAVKSHPELRVRMGIHSGPVNEIADLNEQANIAGAGINIAQRVMDCGDAGHILLSKHVADDLKHYGRWRPCLYELGECAVKHGELISVVNLYTDEIGNPEPPQKFKCRTRRRDAKPEAYRSSKRTVLVVAAGVVLLTFGIFLFFHRSSLLNSNVRGTSAISSKSIAVLPFESLSEDKANAYFAIGVQDEILTRLAKVSQLKVISRTSTQQYQSKPGSVGEIARQLGVTHILEGSVQKAQDSVRVNVQLIKADADAHIWAETYDSKLADVFKVQSEIAVRIATALEAKLSGQELREIGTVGTNNPQAYDAYLRGVALDTAQTREQTLDALASFRRAVELDPNFAAAWAALANREAFEYFRNRTKERLALAQRAMEMAVQLQPDASESFAAAGSFYYYCRQDFDGALDALGKAHARAPSNAFVIMLTGAVKRRQGKLDESIALMHHAGTLDPRNNDVWMNLARSYRGARRFAEAYAMFDHALSISPRDPAILGEKAECYTAAGDLDAAERLLQPPPADFLNEAFDDYFAVFELRRDFDRALALVADAASKLTSLEDQMRARLTIAHLQYAAGRVEEAKPVFEEVRRVLEGLRAAGNQSLWLRDQLLELAAFLGDRATIERESEALLRDTQIDRWRYSQSEELVARAFAVLGDADRALPHIERALSMPAQQGLTPPYLRLDSIWDKIRGDPRFQNLAETNGSPNLIP